MSDIIEFQSDDYVTIYGETAGLAIVCAPTGVYCTVQAGGGACYHPKCEGYTLSVDLYKDEDIKAVNDFDDCSWGCCDADLDFCEEYLRRYAKSIDALLKNHVNNNRHGLIFSFDHERIKELQEGWWPVFIQFTKVNWDHKAEKITHEKKFKGYLHFGNCD